MTVWTRTHTVSDPEAMHEAGKQLGAKLRTGDVIILTGELGAGKTTLTRGIGEGLRVRGPVTSPTFVVARTHPSLIDGPPLIHVDAYRLSGEDELDDLDLDWDGSVVIIEWGQGMVDPGPNWLHITIERQRGRQVTDAWDADIAEPRTITVEAHGERWETEEAW